MEDKKEEMTSKEMSLAADWLKEHGHTDTEVIDFLHFIAQVKPIEDTKTKE